MNTQRNLIILIALSLSAIQLQAETITPSSFEEIWDSGNKFRLMRLQAESLNPYSDNFSSGDIKISYFETQKDFELGQDKSKKRNIGSAHIAVNSDHFFADIGVMDLRYEVNDEDVISNKYSRVYLGARYNDFEYAGISGGLLISESPKVSDEGDFLEHENNASIDPFLSFSAFQFNILLAEVTQDDLFVETISYGYGYDDYFAKVYRTKIHGNNKSNPIQYKDEYIFEFSHKTRCLDDEKLDMIGDCKVQLSRRLTHNDESQGWSVLYDSPYMILNINTYDETTKLRKDKYGISFKIGFNYFDKTSPKRGLRLMLATSYNDGVNDILEVPDTLMFGINFEILGILNYLGELETAQPSTN